MLFSPIPRNRSIASWEAWSNQCFLHGFVVATWCHWGSILHQILDPSHPESSEAEPSSETRKVRKKKKCEHWEWVMTVMTRCFFSSFCSSDGSCLIVKKITYTSVAWDKNLQLSILSSWIRLNLIFFLQLNRTWFLHQKCIRKISVGGFPSTSARRTT